MALDQVILAPLSALDPEPGVDLPLVESSPTVESIGVALSGGGVRASMFSLGVLIALVECGAHRRVKNVSSVSGGSILNAAVAQSCRFAETTMDEFHEVARPIAEQLCRRGAFAFSRPALVSLAGAISAQLGSILVAAALLPSGVRIAVGVLFGPTEPVPWRWIAPVAIVLALVVLIRSRGILQARVYSSFLASLPNGKKRGLLSDFVDSPTTHVIVATDLVSASPVYFSREFVCCPPFGWGIPGSTKTASAVYASSAFPVVFPVRHFLRNRFRFQNGSSTPPFPRALKLADGGVFNNLGTDWFDLLDAQSATEMWEFGNLKLEHPPEPATWQIVVNAGAASRSVRKVLPFLAIPRTMSVLYDNTVRPRLRTMRENSNRDILKSIVIDISDSPYRVAERILDLSTDALAEQQRKLVEERRARARVLVHELGQLGEPYWIEFARQTSGTRTKLTKAGAEAGARLMLHGYLSTLVVMHVLHGVALPPEFKDEGYFLDLAGRKAPPNSRAAEDASIEPGRGK